MGKDIHKTINASCSDSQAALNVSFDTRLILEELQKSIEKRLSKKGIGVQWNDEEAGCDLVVRVIAIEQGSQLLRYILPFLSPAILEVGGQVALDGAAPERFHYVQKAQVGLLGGSAKGMLKVNAQRVGDKIGKAVMRSI